jgi:hypothetical protein
MTNTEAKTILINARENATAINSFPYGPSHFTLDETKDIMRAALTLLPSKELDPRRFVSSVDMSNDGRPSMRDNIYSKESSEPGVDVRFCPKGLFEAVTTGKVNTNKSWMLTSFEAQQFLGQLESKAFRVFECGLDDTDDLSLREVVRRRKETYKAVFALANQE